jgi:hypothetical protein
MLQYNVVNLNIRNNFSVILYFQERGYFTTFPVASLHMASIDRRSDELQIGTDFKRDGREVVEILSQYVGSGVLTL